MFILLATPNEKHAMTFDTVRKEIHDNYFDVFMNAKGRGILSSIVYVNTVKDFKVAKETLIADGYSIVD